MELDFEAPFTDNYINKNPGAGTLKEIKKLKSLNPVYNYQLKNVFLLTKFGVVITENGFPLRDSVTSDMHLKNGMKEIYTAGFMEKDAIELEGSYVSLLGDWSYNFYHWIFEYVPRVLLAEKTGFKGKYIVFPLTKFMLESLELLGIKKERLYIVKRPEEINFFIESLVQPQRISITEPEFQNQLMLIRKAFLKNIRPDKTKKRRIYVQRRQAMNKRNIINEKELLKILKKYDFEIAEMENKSLKAQITLMSESNCYLGGHGAGTVHTLFMKPKSLVMEFFSPNYINHVYTPVAAMLSHNYYMLVPPVSPEASYIYGHDIYAPVGIVDFTLKNQLKK